LEKTSKIMKSNHRPITTVPTKSTRSRRERLLSASAEQHEWSIAPASTLAAAQQHVAAQPKGVGEDEFRVS